MAIDIRSIEAALIKTVRQYIGSKLSVFGEGVNAKASVIRSRVFSTDDETTPTFPDYPYASVDYTRTTDEGYELTERYYNTDGDYVYRTHKLVSCNITFYGTSKDDVFSLCNEMHMLLEVDEVRKMINQLSTTEARVRSKSDPVFVTTPMQDKYREIATFDVILSVLDETVVPSALAPTIDNVEFNTETPLGDEQGGLYTSLEDEDPLLSVEIQTNIP